MSAAVHTRAPRVLVIYKKSAYQIYVHERRHARIKRLIARRDPAVGPLLAAHHSHERALADARQALRALGARAVFRHRSHPSLIDAFDLVVTLGGDGTLLWASHRVGAGVPMLAINTAPRHSVGYFCAAGRAELADVLNGALRGRLRETTLARMRVEIGGELVTNRVLNDVLFCHHSPASTSRYVLVLGRRREAQKSSGVWVGPAAGSTAAQYSAGGRVLPIRSRRLQFVVREPYDAQGRPYALERGLVAPGRSLVIESRMRAGRLYIDGPRVVRVVEMAAAIRLRVSDEPLTLLGFSGKGRRAG